MLDEVRAEQLFRFRLGLPFLLGELLRCRHDGDQWGGIGIIDIDRFAAHAAGLPAAWA